jgi:hypothetical protein
MVWAGRFKKFLEVIGWLSCLVLEIVLGGHDMLLIGAIFFLVIVVVTADSNSDPLWSPFLPLFTGFGSSLSTFASGFLRCPQATTRPAHEVVVF